MGAGPYQIEVGKNIVAIVRAEPGTLRQQRLQAEGAAMMRGQVATEVARRVVETRNDARTDIGDQCLMSRQTFW